MKRMLSACLIGIFVCLVSIQVCEAIILQPGPGDGIDTSVNNQLPDSTHGADQAIAVADLIQQEVHQIAYTLIKFDIPSHLLSVTVDEVTLEMCVSPYIYYMKDDALFAYRIEESWTENDVTWNTMPQIGAQVGQLSITSMPFVLNFEWLTVDITDLFREWQSGSDNFGLLIKNDLEGVTDPYNYLNFFSSDYVDTSFFPEPETLRPLLRITTNEIPEPASICLVCLGILALLRRKR